MTQSKNFTLTPLQSEVLCRIIEDPTTTSAIRCRASVILSSAQGVTIASIARQLKISERTVTRWRRSWRYQLKSIDDLEQENLGDLKSIFLKILAFERQNSQSPELNKEQILGILALQKTDPRDYGRSHHYWTMKDLANEAMKQGIVEEISPIKVSYLIRSLPALEDTDQISYTSGISNSE